MLVVTFAFAFAFLSFGLEPIPVVVTLAIVTAHHHVVTLVLARIEVLRSATVVRTECATIVPIGTREEPPVAAFAKQRIPNATDLRTVNASAAPGRTADAVDAHAADAIAILSILAARIRRTVAGLRFHAERHGGRGIVEVAQMLDVEAVVAVGIERTCALEVSGHVVALILVVLVHPLHGFHGLRVAALAAASSTRRHQLRRRRTPAWIGFVETARHGAIPVLSAAAAVVGVAPIEAVAPHRKRHRIAFRHIAILRDAPS